MTHWNVQTFTDYTWRKAEHENKGRPFDPEKGGGGVANLVGTDYLFSPWVRLEIYLQVNQRQNIYFQPQQFKKKKQK